ncbi:TatD family hydrolase [Alkanindiges sp. WGS2144]|uniref:TatD family hydrolase n=1 Tax=Alkanindiges sp. WGS2144 TaxID=3366808 RepID=UPI003751D1E0
MYIDSHCHLNRLDLTPYEGDLNRALQAARDAGVGRFLAVAVDLDDVPSLAAIAAEHHDVGYSVGVHPCENPAMMARASVEQLCQLASEPQVWAIGETGLDFYHSTEHVPAQKDCFARHIEAGKRIAKPIIVHTRSAKHDTIDVMRAEKASYGILHCFTEDWETASAALDLGFYISFSGIISFKNAQNLRDVARQVPLDRILIETDSPYLAPMPYRSKSNEPLYLPFVAKALADIFGISQEKMGQITSRNFEALLAGHSHSSNPLNA